MTTLQIVQLLRNYLTDPPYAKVVVHQIVGQLKVTFPDKTKFLITVEELK